jgi:uncharacterized membrane protein YhhN
MDFPILLLAFIFALLDWFAVARKLKWLEFIAKPGVMIVLLVWLWLVSRFQGALIWFALGLLFSLAGDVFLMLPRERFIPGLISFLLAHAAYVVGFTRSSPVLNPIALVPAVLVAAVSVQMYRRIAAGLQSSGYAKLKVPVLVYTLVISLMLFAALLTLLRLDWSLETALLVSAGALLFYISDGILAWNKFIHPLRYGKLTIITTYHIGQILITLGAAIHYR